MRKILLIASVVLMSVGVIIFLVAVGIDASSGINPLPHINYMWAGLGIFLAGLVTLIVWFYLRTYLKRKEAEKNNIKRG
ncbi:MAG: hypothetical protein MJ213_01915 [Bacilli bacterium]|nr:hypothetical protein [Bacilli bacterium]